jgi:cytoskeletal protein RodZ
MAKRDAEPEPMDEDLVEAEIPSVGERLRAAREQKGISLEDIAAQSRIPQRHLAAIEAGDWDSLPAPTYTIGFAKSYASAVGLDRSEIGNQLREEMGGQRFATNSTDVFEPADPARTMPKSLVIGAIIAVVVLIAVMSWLNKRSLEEPPPENNVIAKTAVPAPVASQPAPQPAAPTAAQGPVVLSALAPAWIQITDQGRTLFEGMLQPGQNYQVPPSAAAPLLKAGKPEALRINVGNTVAPPVGPPGKVVSKVSLLPADLLKGGQIAAPGQAAPPPVAAPTPAPKPPARSGPPSTTPSPVETPPTNNTGQ